MSAKTVYKQVVDITQEYLGPAADRFVDRIIQFHLNKPPEELTKRDIPKLSEWIKVTLGLLTDNKSMVES
jgi:hypothetical protein